MTSDLQRFSLSVACRDSAQASTSFCGRDCQQKRNWVWRDIASAGRWSLRHSDKDRVPRHRNSGGDAARSLSPARWGWHDSPPIAYAMERWWRRTYSYATSSDEWNEPNYGRPPSCGRLVDKARAFLSFPIYWKKAASSRSSRRALTRRWRLHLHARWTRSTSSLDRYEWVY